jgi:hypothetical protein
MSGYNILKDIHIKNNIPASHRTPTRLSENIVERAKNVFKKLIMFSHLKIDTTCPKYKVLKKLAFYYYLFSAGRTGY